MKTIKFITAAALMLFMTTGNAQTTTTTGKTTSFGIKGGVNFANVRGDDFDGPNARTSFHIGVLAEFPLTDAFSLQTEALYSGQGFQTDIEGTDGKIEYKLDYINVPVLAKIYVTDGLSIEAGPQFSFKVNEQVDDESAAGGTETDEVESFDFGVAGGLTFQTNMGFFASGRYTLGLTDIVKDVDAKNSVFPKTCSPNFTAPLSILTDAKRLFQVPVDPIRVSYENRRLFSFRICRLDRSVLERFVSLRVVESFRS